MFAGLFCFSDAIPVHAHLNEKALSLLQHPGSRVVHAQQVLVCDMAVLCPMFPAGLSAIVRSASGEQWAALWGRLDEPEALAARLGLPLAPPSANRDAELLLAAWHRLGDDLPAALLGDFAAVLVDTQRRRMLLMRDPLGVRPLFYLARPWGIAFASSASGLKALLRERMTVDTDWLARFLTQTSTASDQIAYRGLCKLPPGHVLAASERGPDVPRRWFAWRDDPPKTEQRDPVWVERYLAVLRQAVSCRIGAHRPVATENSGGIDSAAVTGVLAQSLAHPADELLSLTLAMRSLEPPFAMALSRMHGIADNYLLCVSPTETSREVMAHALAAIGFPEESEMGTGHVRFYQECKRHGARVLFSGFGGDEAVSHSGLPLFHELRAQGQWANLRELTRGREPWRTLRFIKGMLAKAQVSDLNPNLADSVPARWAYTVVREDLPAFPDLAATLARSRHYNAGFARVNDAVLSAGLARPLLSARLETCTLVAASHGIEYQWPLLDVRLIQQYLSTPSIEKLGPGGMGRYLHRRALADLAPAEIVWKRNKDMGQAALNQHVFTTGQVHRAELARELEADLHPALADIIDRPKFRIQIARARHGEYDAHFSPAFKRTVQRLRWLDLWLKTEDASGNA